MVCWSVCLIRSCVKTAEAIEMSFEVWTWVVPRSHVLDGVEIHMQGAILRGKGSPL